MLDPYRMITVNILSLFLVGISLIIYKWRNPGKKVNLFFLLIILSVLPLISLLRKGTYESGDLTIHSNFLMGFYENLESGVFIPRWLEKLCAGYGCPVFVFLYPLPFYIASFFHFIGHSYINSIKLLLAFSYIFSGITMYVWAKDHFGKIGGFTASLLYLFAPFHLIDLHFRVSVGEVLSFGFIPLLFFTSKQYIENLDIKYFFLHAITVALAILTHLATFTNIFPFLFLYTLILWIKKKKGKIKIALYYFASICFGGLLSAFYWIPLILEVKWSWSGYQLGITDFKPLQEYLFSPARYGFLFQGHHGETYFIVGYAQILIILLSTVLLCKSAVSKKDKSFLFFFLFSFFLLFFLMQQVSSIIWPYLYPFNNFQFAWRLLAPIAFFSSALGGIVAKTFQKNTFLALFICLFTILTTILNWGNRKTIPVNNKSYLGQISVYVEYSEPHSVYYKRLYEDRVARTEQLANERPMLPIEFLNGEGKIKILKRNPVQHSYIMTIEKDAILKENTHYFPGWKLLVDNQQKPLIFKDKIYPGKILFSLNKGLYKIDVVFVDTPIRRFAANMSFFTLVVLLLFFLVPQLKIRKE